MATFRKVCFYCGHEFEAAHALANICSPDCRQRNYTSPARREWPEPRKPVEVGDEPAETHARPCGMGVQCLRCRKAIEDARGVRQYCSPACRKATQRGRRRAKIRSVYVEPVSLAVLRRRDKDTCRICGKPVDGTRQPPDPSAGTIDHVIALANGGEHSYGNTQLAHLRCNLRKGAS